MNYKNKFMIILGIFLVGCIVISASSATDIQSADDVSQLSEGNEKLPSYVVLQQGSPNFYEGGICDLEVAVYDGDELSQVKLNGTVTLTMDGNTQTKTLKDGCAVFIFKGLEAGKYEATAYYSGDDTYAPGNDTCQFEVEEKIKVDLFVSEAPGAPFYSGDDVPVTVAIGHLNKAKEWTTDENARGYVYIYLDGVTIKAKVVNGVAKAIFKDVTGVGPHTIYAYYTGDSSHDSAYGESTFDVNKKDNSGNNKKSNSNSDSTLPDTGNPLLLLIIALSAVGVGSLRRR